MNNSSLAQQQIQSSQTPAPLNSSFLQRKTCSCGRPITANGECAECRRKRLSLQRRVVNQAGPEVAPPIVHEVLRSPGQPMDAGTRAFMEPRFDHDFSQVRVHTDGKAAQSAQAVNSWAYTVGNNIVFDRGQYEPSTRNGQKLLAHELTHVLQQHWQPHLHTSSIQIGPINDRFERQAEKNSLDFIGTSSWATTKLDGSAVAGTKQMLRRWSITGNMATSDSSSDTLGRLAKSVGAEFNDWKCIKPISMRTFSSGSASGHRNENYERFIQIGDQFDISNLTATSGVNLRIHLFDPGSESRDAGIAQNFYPGSVSSPNSDVDIDIESAAVNGATPIQGFLVFGHAAGPTMWGGAVASFRPADLAPEDPAPTFGQAERGFLPRRCWFTRNSTARSVGCNSSAFGNDFAATYLRKGASIVTTTAAVRPKCQGLPFQVGSFLGIPGGCAWYNGLDFATGSGIGATTLEGPFWSVTDFHAGSHWATIAGKL